MSEGIEVIRKALAAAAFYSGPDATPKETYVRRCHELINEIDRLRKLLDIVTGHVAEDK